MNLTSDDILGKEAVDPEGEVLGIVMKLHLDPVAKSIIGITVDQGMWKPDLFIGIEFLEKFGIDAIFLNSIPYTKYSGMEVYSYDGIFLGTVSQVNGEKSKIHNIVVSCKDEKSRNPLKKREFTISEKSISEIGFSVILKKGTETALLDS
ncbi:hypothetical protein [Leptospira sp. GIMC2001]|uniref:hypothetical protein n=1 Tax=Leptospira sp. GIMC2001 TaxID=1513297 RepID=UPI00234A7C65|nr:hypothetical protein [Leptospira sp. GIMC2001]WCL49455.1 hypothetical protein O4O04_19530 [Leptospira sp. GIMC2001]